jgi:hypothetical protein
LVGIAGSEGMGTERQGVKLARTAAKSRKISGVNIMLAGTTHNNNAGGL